MTIDFTCPHCGKHMSVADQYAGQTGPCSNCGQAITIPGKPFGAAPVPNYDPRPASSGAGISIGVILVVFLVGGLMCAGILVALLLPAVQAAREAARRTGSSNNMKQIALAFHNYHDTYNSFPPAVVTDADGNPLYSGRVLLLPFMEQQPVYDRWDKSKAWDSPENLPLAQTAFKVFEDPSAFPATPGRTDYLFVTGPGSAMDLAAWQKGDGLSFRDITDGTSNTLLVIEVKNSGVSWAEPKDIDISQLQNGLPPGNHPGGNLVGMVDASVRFVNRDADSAVIRGMATRDGGEVLSAP